MIRRWFALAAILVIAIAVVRTASVAAWSATEPQRAQRLWAGHPEVERNLAMAGVGEAARAGRPAGPDTARLLELLAVKEPLAVEPLLVRAVAAESAGDGARAEQLFSIAEARQGRALPPHYFLAELYLRSGRIEDGLREVANLSRLSPGGITGGVQYVAQYARDPANWPDMRAVFRSHPDLVDPILLSLAGDAANTRTILALADARHRGPDARWFRPLLDATIAGGQYGAARSLWATVGGLPNAAGELIHDPTFADARLPPPFNWDLAQTPAGLAERSHGSGLHVIFYGSQGGPLVRQLLLLAPGNYRLALRSAGEISDPQALSWSVRCDKSAIPLATLAMPRPGAFELQFTVPPGCPAQWLQLDGRAEDISGRSDVTIGSIELHGGGPNG